MKLEHEFAVSAPIDTVWRALLDPHHHPLAAQATRRSLDLGDGRAE
jgi:uncharacterized protein YndB with AHSA1/START domain